MLSTENFDFSLLEEFAIPEMLIAGVDEVGRGCLFGPVVAATVVFPISDISQLIEIGVRDSKQLSAKRRLELAKEIKKLARAYQVSYASVREIERLNILQASLLAMRRSVIKVSVQPALCLVDGKQNIPSLPILQKTVVQGDKRSPVIAAASILAKVWRDELMLRLARKYPEYDLAANKGYGTARHLLALQKYGPCAQHRLAFAPCRVKVERLGYARVETLSSLQDSCTD